MQVWNLYGRVDVGKIAKAVDTDNFEVYAFHQSSKTKMNSLIDASDVLKNYEKHDTDARSTNVLFVDPTRFTVVDTESLGSAGDLYELQKVGGSERMYVASISMEAIPMRSISQLIKNLRNDKRMLKGTLLVSAKYNNTKFKELMNGRLDLSKDKTTFTYVHRLDKDYDVSVAKSMFGGGSAVAPSAMTLSKLVKDDDPPPVVDAHEKKTPLYYGVALTGDSSLKPLTSRHDFVAVSHDKPFDTIFDTHLTFKTGNMTTFVLKDGFELVQAVYEGSEASKMHAIYGRNIATSTSILFINIDMDTDPIGLLNAVISRLGITDSIPDRVVIAGTFPEKYSVNWKPFTEKLESIEMHRIDAYSRNDRVYTFLS